MGKYDDIIDLPHYEPKEHPRMSMLARAAQFAPFAALTGHEAMIKETARLTDEMIERDDETNQVLNEKIKQLQENIHEHPEVTITYFQPDALKQGGAYQCLSGRLKSIDQVDGKMVFETGEEIKLHLLLDIY